MRSLTITHVDSEITWRGGQQSLLNLAKGLRARGHRQSIVAPEGSALVERARGEGFEVVGRIARDADIVHAHSGRAHNAVIRATVGAAAKKIVTRHVAFSPKHPAIHRFKYATLCDGVIAVSDAVREVLVRSGVPAAQIEVIHTGIEVPEVIAPRPASGPLTVGHMGAFTREKGQDVLIEAARALPEMRFVLAGEGELRGESQAKAPANVEFVGFVADQAAFFAKLDVFVMPSRSEAWGLAAVQALAHGVPVIASDIEGLAEIVQAGKNGWLFPSGDVEALVDRLRGIERRGLAALAEAARARAAEFTIEAMAERTERFYAKILQLS